jgi:ribose transport system permease protein
MSRRAAGPVDGAHRDARRGRAATVFHRHGYAAMAYLLVAALVVVNAVFESGFFEWDALAQLVAGAAPVVILAIAVTVPILGGNGGIDLTVGPLLGLINVTVILCISYGYIGSGPEVVVPVALGMGIASGILNGALIAYLRIQPIVVTLASFLVYQAIAATVLPVASILPGGGGAPKWLTQFAGSFGPVPAALVPIGIVLAIWLGLGRLPYYRYLYAMGDSEAVAFASGVPTAVVKVGAYAICGLFTAVGALAMTALIGSGDARIGAPLTLTAIAGAALGGTSLAGGRGGVLGALAGGFAVYLVQNALTVSHVSDFYVTFAYGAVLVGGIIVNGLLGGLQRARA